MRVRVFCDCFLLTTSVVGPQPQEGSVEASVGETLDRLPQSRFEVLSTLMFILVEG